MRAIDLFCGTGGFSRGAHMAGFEVAAAFDIDANLTHSFRTNFPKTKLVLTDIAKLSSDAVREHVGEDHIDLVFGGPPCQGFSAIGRRDEKDPRRELLGNFFRLVSEMRPSAFVMENVEGLLYSDARHVLDEALEAVADYTVIGPEVLNAADFGAATNRRRAFVVGYDPSISAPIAWGDIELKKKKAATVRDAIADLGSPTSLDEDDEGFDVWRAGENSLNSEYAAQLRCESGSFTGNRRTKHLRRVVKRFSKMPEGGFDPVGKYPRLAWNGQCPTLRAGTGADKGSHQAIRPIHPSENRVITVREAARLQGFPDDHRFHPTIWHSFRQIGNSVSPIMAAAILSAIHDRLQEGSLAEAAE